jgi:hypothetical protein
MNSTLIVNEDNQAQLIALINFLNKTISQYGLGLIWLFGNIGSTLNCVVFYQPAFRKSPCAMYFLASNFSQLLALNFALFVRMLQYGYNIQLVNMFVWFCKVRFYLFYILVANSRYNIIMASMDRYFASSRSALRRQWSSSKIALRFIIGTAFLWFLIYLQVIFFYQIQDTNCQPQSGVYGVFFSIYISIDSGILPIFLMLLFGLLTAKNVHQTKRRIGVTARIKQDQPVQANKMSKKDVQLHRMLANQIFLFLILNIPNPCYLVYHAFTMYTVKSPFRLTVELFVNNMTYVPLYLGFALTFANFAISSSMFRREFQQLIQRKILSRLTQRVTNAGGTTEKIGHTVN